MINEVLEAQDYLDGKNINKNNLYRTIYLMAKYHVSQGLSVPEIRQKIFDWGKRNSVWIKYSVNDIVIRAADDKKPLSNPECVYVSDADISRIVNLFDSRRVRYCAFAMLCYAKTYADSRGEFPLSSVPFSNWVGVDRTSFQQRVLKEIDMFNYIRVIKTQQKKPRWGDGEHLATTRYKILVPHENVGEYRLVGNDVYTLFDELFKSK